MEGLIVIHNNVNNKIILLSYAHLKNDNRHKQLTDLWNFELDKFDLLLIKPFSLYAQ